MKDSPDAPGAEQPKKPTIAERAEAVASVTVPADFLENIVEKFQVLAGGVQAMQSELVAIRQRNDARFEALATEVAKMAESSRGGPAGPEPGELNPEMMYIRIKPYNPKIGHVRKRQYFDELKRVAIGGTGGPGSIPQWYEVEPSVARGMEKYRQRDGDPRSPAVLDICTAEQRYKIDAAEELWRRSQIGISGHPDQMAKQTRAQTRATTTRTMPQAVPTAPNPPSMVAGAEEYDAEGPAVGTRQAAERGRDAAVLDIPDAELPPEIASALSFAEQNPMKGGPLPVE